MSQMLSRAYIRQPCRAAYSWCGQRWSRWNRGRRSHRAIACLRIQTQLADAKLPSGSYPVRLGRRCRSCFPGEYQTSCYSRAKAQPKAAALGGHRPTALGNNSRADRSNRDRLAQPNRAARCAHGSNWPTNWDWARCNPARRIYRTQSRRPNQSAISHSARIHRMYRWSRGIDDFLRHRGQR